SGRFDADRLANAAQGGDGALGAVIFAIGIFVASWVIAASLALLVERLREPTAAGTPLASRLRALPAAFYGMLVAHLGVGVFAIGVACVNSRSREADRAVAIGEQFELGGYTFRLAGLEDVDGANYDATRGRIEVTKDGSRFVLTPEKR